MRRLVEEISMTFGLGVSILFFVTLFYRWLRRFARALERLGL